MVKKEKNKYNFINNYALRNAFFREGYDPCDREVAKTLGVKKSTYERWTSGQNKMPLDYMIEILVRCRMTKDEFIEAFWDVFDEEGNLDTMEAQRVYNNIQERRMLCSMK